MLLKNRGYSFAMWSMIFAVVIAAAAMFLTPVKRALTSKTLKTTDMALWRIWGEGVVAKSSLSGIDSIIGTILDPNNPNGIWEEVSPAEVRLKPNNTLTQNDVRLIAKENFDKVWAIIQGMQEEGGYNHSQIYDADDPNITKTTQDIENTALEYDGKSHMILDVTSGTTASYKSY